MHKMLFPATLVSFLLISAGCDEKKEQVRQEVKERVEKAREVKEKVEDGAKTVVKESAEKLLHREKNGMLALSDEEFRQKMQDDLVELRRYDEGLERTFAYARSRPDLFPDDKMARLSTSQRRELREIWATILDYMLALDGLKQYWRDFHKVNIVTARERHAASFLLGYAAFMTQYHYGLEFIDMAMGKGPLEILLDESNPMQSLPKKGFSSLKHNIINPKAFSRFVASRNYYKLQRDVVGTSHCTDWAECKWALDRLISHHEVTKERLAKRPGLRTGYQAFDVARDLTFDTWFPVQKNVAEWMGDTRVYRLHNHLISKEQIDTMHALMAPGDIIVARHNWYLSNIGLPGFWPHAELYIGSPDELAAYLDVPEVTEALKKEMKGKKFSEHLAATFPEVWKKYQETDHDHPYRVLEAISEGVVLSTLEHGAGADYVGVIRPKRDKADKARAIIRAFEYYGRPYDFNFDFLTDESLVCTELVYKAWEPSKKKKGVNFEMVQVMGRNTLPANDLVRQFAKQLDLPEEKRDLEFVYFLDGHERAKGAIVSNEEAFKVSYLRPKWDIMQD